jgi:hypothetical protein
MSMKIFFMILFSTVFLFGCEKNPVEEAGNAYIGAYKRGQEAGKTGNLYAVKQSLQAYHAVHGSYPETLEDLDAMIGEDLDTSLFDYDPQTGKVSLKK